MLPSLVTTGCSSFPPVIDAKVSAAAVLDKVPKVDAWKANTCEQKKQIAAQKSYLESAASDKTVVYAADCKPDVTPAPNATPKTTS